MVRAILITAFVVAIPTLTFARGESAKVSKSPALKSQKISSKNHDMGAHSGGRVHSAASNKSSSGQTGAHARNVSFTGK